MNSKISFKVPTFSELDYRKKLLADEETMSYNIGYEQFKGYNRETGCIDFNEDVWSEWYSMWIGKTPERYYAYVVKLEDLEPIGEVALRLDKDLNGHCISIIIESKHRGRGYSEEALRQLVHVAFNDLNINRVFDNFPSSRVSAEKVFRRVGFRRISEDFVELNKEEYFR